jgi:hypothetical protein
LNKGGWSWKKRSGGFKRKDIGDYVLTRGNYSVQPHYPGMGRGLARSLFTLVRGASQLYKGSWCPKSGTRHPWIWVDAYWGSTHYNGISGAAGRHLGSPAMAPELRSGGGTAGACRGGRLHRVGTRIKVDRWKTLFDYPERKSCG